MQHLKNSVPEQMYDTINCKYYNEESLKNATRNLKTKVSLYPQNIRSLNKHCLELITFLECLETDFDFIGLTEIGKCNIAS